jgi:hypothetical protein
MNKRLEAAGFIFASVVFAGAGLLFSQTEYGGLAKPRQSIEIDMGNWQNDLVTAECKRSYVTDSPVHVAEISSGANVYISYSGDLVLCSFAQIAVNFSSGYEMKVRYRIRSADGSPASVKALIGMATFDASGAMETTAPGAHRYGVSAKPVKSSEDWIVASGKFRGAGPDYNKFRETTKTARALVFFQKTEGTPVIDLDYINVTEE